MPAPETGAIARPSGLDLVPARPLLEAGVRAWLPLGPGDQPLVAAGDTVAAGTPLGNRVRDHHVREVRPSRGGRATMPGPGGTWRPDPARNRRAEGDREGEVLFELSGRWRVVTGEPAESLETPFDATIVEVRRGAGIRLETSAQAVRGVSALGEPVH